MLAVLKVMGDDGERLIYILEQPPPDGIWQLILTPPELLDRLARQSASFFGECPWSMAREYQGEICR